MPPHDKKSISAFMILLIGILIIGGLSIVSSLHVGEGFIFSIFQKGEGIDTKKYFLDLQIEIEKVYHGAETITFLPFYIEKGYILVEFDKGSQKVGPYLAPQECGGQTCLVICESSTFKKEDNCQKPLAYAAYYENEYPNLDFITSEKDNTIVNGKKIINLYVKKEEPNFIRIDQETDILKQEYGEAIKQVIIEIPPYDLSECSIIKLDELIKQRVSRYSNLIEQIAQEIGLPKELVDANIPKGIITQESKGDRYAVSPTGAAGLMQLIKATAERYGLKVPDYGVETVMFNKEPFVVSKCNWYHKLSCDLQNDERFNEEKSIRAGLMYLKFLYQKFNNVELALAAYNGGEGYIGKNCQTDFNSCKDKLRKETKCYVPLVLEYSKEFGTALA